MMRSVKVIITTVIMAALTILVFTACSDDRETVVEQTASETAPLLYETETTAGSNGAETAAADVGVEKIREIILAKVPGAAEADIYELEREYDDGRLEYEGSIYYDGYEYEFEIDGATGNILQWEIDD